MRIDAFFIFLYFLKTCVEINALTVTDCSLLRLRKLAYHRQQPLKVILVTKMANQSLYPIAHPQPYNHHHKARSCFSHQYLGFGIYFPGHVFYSISSTERQFQFEHSFLPSYYMHQTEIQNLFTKCTAEQYWSVTRMYQNRHLGTSHYAKKGPLPSAHCYIYFSV